MAIPLIIRGNQRWILTNRDRSKSETHITILSKGVSEFLDSSEDLDRQIC